MGITQFFYHSTFFSACTLNSFYLLNFSKVLAKDYDFISQVSSSQQGILCPEHIDALSILHQWCTGPYPALNMKNIHNYLKLSFNCCVYMVNFNTPESKFQTRCDTVQL